MKSISNTTIITVAIAALVLAVMVIRPDLFASSPDPDPNAVLPVELVVIETANGSFKFTAEIADEPAEREKGLMFREEMLPTHGMLFDFGVTQQVIMWMENTPLALDMVFLQEDGQVVSVAENTVPFSRDYIFSGVPVRFVLELNAGVASRIGLEAGHKVLHPIFDSAPKESSN